MRGLSRAGIILLSASILLSPFTAHAYSEWPAISIQMSKMAEQSGCQIYCDLKDMKGDIRFRRADFSGMTSLCRFMRVMIALGHYLAENTNAGQTYMIFVHFDDHVRSIDVSELQALEREHRGTTDMHALGDFLAKLHSE